MDNRIKWDIRIHHIMALVGGFLGAYGMIIRAGNFGASETTNMISMIVSLLGNDIKTTIFRIIALIIYIIAFAITVIIPKKSKVDVRYISVIIDIIGIVILAFIPQNIDAVVALFPIFFIAAFQYNAFAKIKDYNCATIFSTNNLRQMVIGFTEYAIDKNEKELDRGKFFGATLIWYHIGVVIAYYATKWWHIKGVLVAIIPVVLAGIIMLITEFNKNYIDEN